jgi:hypothetical protein
MGHFLATTAFRGVTVDEVAGAIAEHLASHDVKHQVLDGSGPPNEETDALIFAPRDSWVVVLWPTYFNVHDFPLVTGIGKARGWLISTVHVYDGDYWEHLAVHGAERLHSFCSFPTYWEDEASEAERLASFDPDPQRLSTALNVPASVLQPYLVDAGSVDEGAKAHPEDEFALADIWVFTDFWRRLGITYPDPPTNPAAVVRMSKWFGKRLPNG